MIARRRNCIKLGGPDGGLGACPKGDLVQDQHESMTPCSSWKQKNQITIVC